MKSEKLRVKSTKFGEFRGITLISLIITIIILIILVGIAINLSLGENGLFNKAQYAKEETNKQTATEKINLKITTAQMNKYAEKQEMPTLKELAEVLKEDEEIAYVTEVSQIASTKYEVGDEPTTIYTKLNKYPYEFEIDSSLRLASINGIKIANNNEIPEGYIKPEGTIKITEKKENIDVGKYKYADTTELYTKSEMIKNSKELTILDNNRSEYEISEGIQLAYIIVTRATTNVPYTITISGDIITSNEKVSETNRMDVNVASYIDIYKVELSGNAGKIKLSASGGNAQGQAWNACIVY